MDNQAFSLNDFVRTPLASKFVNLSESTLEKLRVSGEGPPYYKPGKRVVLYKIQDLFDWLESNKKSSTSE